VRADIQMEVLVDNPTAEVAVAEVQLDM